METVSKSVETLNELIEINNDRVAGFEKAMTDIKDENADLKALFQDFSSQSRTFSQELTALVTQSGEEYEKDTSVAGTLHRAWIDVKSLFGANDRHGILAEAERGEDAIKKAYENAIASGDLIGEGLNTVVRQSQEINSAHDKIKALRDTAK